MKSKKNRFLLRMGGLIEAQTFDEALAKLADHVGKLSNGVLPPDLFVPPTGDFELKEWVPGSQQWDQAWDRFDKERDDGERGRSVEDGESAGPEAAGAGTADHR